MTPQQLVAIAVRLFAVWLALLSFGYFISIPNALESLPGEGGKAGYAYVIGVVYVVVAVGLWLFPLFVAQTLLPRTRHENRLVGNAHELARVGASLIGLWLFAKALPSVVWFVFRSLFIAEAISSFSAISPEARLELAVAAFELLFAAFLVVKAGAFAKLVVPEVKAETGPQNGL